MKVRVYYKPDGTVSVIYPAPKAQKPNESEDDFLNRVFEDAAKNSGFEDLPFDDIDPSQLPPRSDRDAWRGDKTKKVFVDPVVKEKIQQDRMIQEKIFEMDKEEKRKNAVAALKAEGRLPPNA